MKKIILILVMLSFGLMGCELNEQTTETPTDSQTQETGSEDMLNNPKVVDEVEALKTTNNELMVDPCDQSGEREAKVKVDIGYDSTYATRDYYAYTNESAQVVYVEAEELIVQDDDKEKDDVNSDGRYCNDEAKVPGTEDEKLDEGHVIADSLGGVGNAYNITPQDSELNREGAQYEMEEDIRNALNNGQTVTNFEAYITYPDNETQTPNHYYFTYEIDGETYNIDFANN